MAKKAKENSIVKLGAGKQEDTGVERDERGRLLPGSKTLNPGGRPKAIAQLRELCQASTKDAVRVLRDIMLDEKAKKSDRIAAANSLLDRGYGRPGQSADYGATMGKGGGKIEVELSIKPPPGVQYAEIVDESD